MVRLTMAEAVSTSQLDEFVRAIRSPGQATHSLEPNCLFGTSAIVAVIRLLAACTQLSMGTDRGLRRWVACDMAAYGTRSLAAAAASVDSDMIAFAECPVECDVGVAAVAAEWYTVEIIPADCQLC